MIDNDMVFPITYTGSTFLITNSHTSSLNDVLCVPNKKNNIIYISEFCTSNCVSIEFLSIAFHVNDLHTWAILLKGLTKDGVYE